MTVIAYRNGEMASDSGMFRADRLVGTTTKVWKLANGDLFGAAGDASDCAALKQWVEDGCNGLAPHHPDRPLTGMIVSHVDDAVYYVENGHAYEVKANFHAIGAGCDLAVGVMSVNPALGAVVAVHAAIGNLPGSCAGPIQSVRTDRREAEIEAEAAAAEAAASAAQQAETETASMIAKATKGAGAKRGKKH